MLRDELYAEIERLTEQLRAMRREKHPARMRSIERAAVIRGATLALVTQLGLDRHEAARVARGLVAEEARRGREG